MSGRPRISTLVISGLFLAVLALYFLVRPVPDPQPAGNDPAHCQFFPDRIHARARAHTDLALADPVTSPVGHGQSLGHADQQFADAGRVSDHGAAHPRHVAVRRVADPVTSRPGVRARRRITRRPDLRGAVTPGSVTGGQNTPYQGFSDPRSRTP